MTHFKHRDAGAWCQSILYITFIKMCQMLTKFIVKQKTQNQAVTLSFDLNTSELSCKAKKSNDTQ